MTAAEIEMTLNPMLIQCFNQQRHAFCHELFFHLKRWSTFVWTCLSIVQDAFTSLRFSVVVGYLI